MTNPKHDPVSDTRPDDPAQAHKIEEIAATLTAPVDEMADDEQLLEAEEGVREREDLPANDILDEDVLAENEGAADETPARE